MKKLLVAGLLLVLFPYSLGQIYFVEQAGTTGKSVSYNNGTGILLSGLTFSLQTSYTDVLYCHADGTNCPLVSNNASWNETRANSLYYPLNSNPLGFYNVTTLPPSGGSSSGGSPWNVSGSAVILNTTSHFVGIGTTTPTQKLEVNGNINLTGNLFIHGNITSYSPLILQTNGVTWMTVYDNGTVVFNGGINAQNVSATTVSSNNLTVNNLVVNGTGGNTCLSNGTNCQENTIIGALGSRVRVNGSQLNGTDGQTSRSYSYNRSITVNNFVSVGKNVMQQDTDYVLFTNVSSSDSIRFIVPIFNDDIILLWTDTGQFTKTTYTGSQFTGTNGQRNRNITHLDTIKNFAQVSMGRVILDPDTDYSLANNTRVNDTIIITTELFNDDKVTIWT